MAKGFMVKHKEFIPSPSEIYIYNLGDVCTDITGGWSGGKAYSDFPNTGSGALESDKIRVTGTSSGSYGYMTNNAIDVTGFNYVVVDMHETNEQSYGSFDLHSVRIPVLVASALVRFDPSLQTRETFVIDISSIMGSVYFLVSSAYSYPTYLYSAKLTNTL